MIRGVRTEVVLWAGAFCVFAVLAAPGATWMDPGELVAAAFSLGGAHPPGHPGYTLLGKLAALVPIGEVAFRVALLSAAAMAAAVAGVYALARALVPDQPVPAVVAAALATAAPVLQVNATRAEVYAPVAALLVWAMVATVRFVRGGAAADARLALAAAFACALAAAIHPLIAVSAAAPMAIAIAARARARLLRIAPAAIALAILGAATYLYLPLRANAADPPLLMWNDPATAASLWDLVRAPAYHDNFAASGLLRRAGALAVLVGEGAGAGILFAGLVGLAFAALTGLRGAGVVLAGAACVIIGGATQAALNPDMPGYVAPALLFLAAGIAPAIAAVVRALPDELRAGPRRHGIAAGLALPVVALGLAAPTVRAADAGARDGDAPLRYWSETVARMPPGPGLFFANADHSLFAAWYERIVAGGRPDIAVANAELCRDRWFLAHVDRALDELYVPFIDDGVRGNTAERLAVSNLREGRAVGGDEPSFARLDPRLAAARGRGYLYMLAPADAPPGEEARPPPAYPGSVGARVAGHVGLVRALYEAQRDRLDAAAVAAGQADRFGEAGLAALARAAGPSPRRPALYWRVPRAGRVFVFERWQADLLGDDLAWVAGVTVAAPRDDAAMPRRIHAVWRGLLDGSVDPGAGALRGFDRDVGLATVRMLEQIGRSDLAEALRRAIDAPE